MKKLIVGNWKMNPDTVEDAKKIISKINKVSDLINTEIIICPPSIYISLLKTKRDGFINVGAQNVNENEKGAFTGEISAPMLNSLGVKYCIVGHSERRKMGETDDLISKKANILLSNDIKPIICVGEKERDSDSTHLGFISQQISKSLFLIDTRHISSIIIAYEPIWAVGAPEPMKTTEICETTIFIKKILSDLMGQEKAIKIPILYGGAVNKINAKEIIKEGKVDGLLIGRESVDANNFIELIKSI